ncbi:MAG: T9SS type A sorting domain-containing protein [Cytophagaceae bacterium]
MRASVILFFIGISIFFVNVAKSQTYTQAGGNGTWNHASNWTNDVPGEGTTAHMNHALNLTSNIGINGGHYYINATLTDQPGGGAHRLTVQNGTIDFSANAVFEGNNNVIDNNGVLIIRSGATVTIGSLTFRNNSYVLIESGGTLIVNGNLTNWNNSDDIYVHGFIQVNGTLIGNNGSSVEGDGYIVADKIETNGGNTGSFFGSTTPCNTGPCNTSTLCGFSNTLNVATTTVCSGSSVIITGTSISAPTYRWQRSTTSNSTGFTNIAGATGQNYTASPTVNTWFRRVATSGGCTNISASVAITVATATTPSVSIARTAGTNPMCQGASVTFTATPTNGGATPAYQWRVNGTNVGTNSPTFTTTTLPSGSPIISCVMTSNAACASPATATSNNITMTVNPSVTPSVTIARTAGTNPTCTGNSVTFTATPTNGGATPSYQWRVNGANVGTNSPTFTTTTLPAGSPVISCRMTSSLTCPTVNPVTSNSITMQIINGTAGTWTGAANNNWNNAANWCETVPTADTDVIINAGSANNPVIGSNAICRNLIINTGATLTLQNNQTLDVKGNWENIGTFTGNQGTVVFSGASNQEITGNTDFPHVIINKSGSLIVNSPVVVNRILTLTSGTISSNGNLTINLSTGAISKDGTGSINGNITAQKDINRDMNSYISVPFSNLTVSDVNNTLPVLSGAGTRLYWYNEAVVNTNKNIGWVAMQNTNLAAPIVRGRGYTLNFPSPQAFSLSGDYNHSFSLDTLRLHNTPSGNDNADGWHLIGNPYLTTLDWNSPDLFSENIDDAVYIYSQTDATSGIWRYYVRDEEEDEGINGGSRYIGSMQSFWVKSNVAGETGKLFLPRGTRTTESNPQVYRRANFSTSLKFSLSDETLTDEAIIRIREHASTGFDKSADAEKFLNSANNISLFTEFDGKRYAINSFNDFDEHMIIPVTIYAPTSNTFTFKADNIEKFDDEYDVFLEDKTSNKMINLRQEPNFTFTASNGFLRDRFFIHLAPAYSSTSERLTSTLQNFDQDINIFSYQNNVNVKTNNLSGVADIYVYDLLGHEVAKLSNASLEELNTITIRSANGIYLVKVISQNGNYTGKVYISEN